MLLNKPTKTGKYTHWIIVRKFCTISFQDKNHTWSEPNSNNKCVTGRAEKVIDHIHEKCGFLVNYSTSLFWWGAPTQGP